MNKYFVELIGAFFVVLTIGTAAGMGHAGALAPLAIGSMLMVMVFACGHVSGAHFNPAATLAILMRGKVAKSDVVGYLAGQTIGASLAAVTVIYLAGEMTFSAVEYTVGPLFVVEVLFTFALCWVVLNTATSMGTDGNSFYGLAIGFTVAAGAFAVGPISSAVFNPAVVIGLCIMGLADWGSIWIYCVAQLLGAVLAALAFKFLVKE